MFPSVRPFLTFGVLCVVAASASAATVSGTVTAAATHTPLASMTVVAYDTSGVLRGAPAITGADGRYSLSLPAGNYRLLAYDPAGIYATSFSGGAESFDTSPFTSVVTSATLDFALVKGGFLGGNVTNASGAARSSITVAAYNLSGTKRAFTITNASGLYQLVLPPGDYKLVAYDESGVYATTFYRTGRTFEEALVLHVSEAATTSASFRVEAAAHVQGRTVDKTTGGVLPAMVIYAYTAEGTFVSSTTSNALGAFSLALPPGTYRLAAADPARVYATAFSGGTKSFTTAAIIDLSPSETQANVTLELERAAHISGRVTPAANVIVFAYNVDGTAHTSARPDANGDYELVVAPGTYKLAAIDDSLAYAPQFWSHRSDFASASEIFVVAGGSHSGFDFALERAGRISGNVGAPNINVSAYDAAGVLAATTRSALDGSYTLVVAPGAYRVLAFDDQLFYATSYAGDATSYDATIPVVVTADATVIANITLRRGVKLPGTVASIDGEPLDDVEVFALEASGDRAAATTSRGGTFTFSLAPATYHFVAFDRTGRFASQTLDEPVTITQSQTPLPIHFVLSGAGRHRAARH